MSLVNPLSLPAVEAEMSTASYSLTTTSWESVGVTLALPAAGRWLILGPVRAQLRTTVGSAAMSFRLYTRQYVPKQQWQRLAHQLARSTAPC